MSSMENLKNELTDLVFDFVKDVDLHNARQTDPFEDPVEYTFHNFIKWLDHEEN